MIRKAISILTSAFLASFAVAQTYTYNSSTGEMLINNGSGLSPSDFQSIAPGATVPGGTETIGTISTVMASSISGTISDAAKLQPTYQASDSAGTIYEQILSNSDIKSYVNDILGIQGTGITYDVGASVTVSSGSTVTIEGDNPNGMLSGTNAMKGDGVTSFTNNGDIIVNGSTSGMTSLLKYTDIDADTQYDITIALNGTGTVNVNEATVYGEHAIIVFDDALVGDLTIGGTYTITAGTLLTNVNVYGAKLTSSETFWPRHNVDITEDGSLVVSNTGIAGSTYGIYSEEGISSSIQGTISVTSSHNSYGISAMGNLDIYDFAGSITATTTDDTAEAVALESITSSGIEVFYEVSVVVDGDASITASGGAINYAVRSTVDGDNENGEKGSVYFGGEGTLTVTGDIYADGKIWADDGVAVAFVNDDTYVKGYILGGNDTSNGAKFATAVYDIQENVAANNLIGTYTAAAEGEGRRLEITQGYTGSYTTENDIVSVDFETNTADNNSISYTINKNSYIEDVLAQTSEEKQIAKVLDRTESVDNGGEIDQSLAAAKLSGAANFETISPAYAAKYAHNNTQFAESVYLDNFMLAGRKLGQWVTLRKESEQVPDYFKVEERDMEVSVRSLGGVGKAGAESGVKDYKYNNYGALANIDKLSGDFYYGIGVGGGYSHIKDHSAGKGDTGAVMVTPYVSWAFADNFEWHTSAYYAYAMNSFKRNDPMGEVKGDWNANVLGIFSAVRYEIKINQEFSVKPFIGVSATYNMQEGYTEDDGGVIQYYVDSKDYMSVKSVIGVEAVWTPIETLYVSASAMYTHEFADNNYDISAVANGLPIGITGYKTSRDAVIGRVGIYYNLTPEWTVGGFYSLEYRSSEANSGFGLSAGYKF